MIIPEPVRMYDARAQEWRTVTVEVTPEPSRRGRSRTRRPVRQGAPRDLSGLSDGSPLEPYWCDTAYSETGPLADLRTWTKPSVMRTHRAATVMPADPGRVTARKPSDRLDV